MEKAHSNGLLNTRENSLLETMKSFFVKATARTDFEKWSLRDLKTATSRGWRA